MIRNDNRWMGCKRAPGAGGGTWMRALARGQDLGKRGRYEEAAECFAEAMALGGDHPELYSSMGEAQQDMGRIEEAMSYFDRAIKANPRHTTALFKKAEALPAPYARLVVAV